MNALQQWINGSNLPPYEWAFGGFWWGVIAGWVGYYLWLKLRFALARFFAYQDRKLKAALEQDLHNMEKKYGQRN